MADERVPGTAILAAGCKINLFLTITGRRDDGYHTLESLFLPLPAPCDRISVTNLPGADGLAFTCTDPALEGSGNLLVKTYAAYVRATGFSPGLKVHLEKNIPYGAGLGGGSSDAATLLLYMNDAAKRSAGNFLCNAGLRALAASLGADVPFFLLNSPAMVTGIGDVIQETANPVAGMHLVLVCPKAHVPTAWAFAAWDKKNAETRGSALTSGQEQDSSPLVHGVSVKNDLRDVVFERHPHLRQLIAVLYECKAVAAEMSGSGSSVFGLFSSKKDATLAAARLSLNGELVFQHTL